MWNPTHPILILACSGRALAQAAAAAGYEVRIADCYADQETRHAASAWVRVAFNAETNHWRRGVAQLITETTKPIGFLYGGGLENYPDFIEELNHRGKLLGNTPQCVRLLKDPRCFFPLLQELAIPMPETQMHPPPNPGGWLCKAVAGAGGCHVLPAEAAVETACYYQRKLEGQPGSVLFLANGKTAQILGYNHLWTAPIPTTPYRYGGIAAPLDLAPSACTRLQNYIDALVAATGLRGLNGLDFIQQKEEIQVLEINPRPPASLDLYQGLLLNLFEAHIQTCSGSCLPSALPILPTARAFAIFYAPYRLQIPPNLIWPAFCRDRPVANSTLEKDEPVCSIHATAPNIEACQWLIARRQRHILKLLTPTS